MVAEHAMNMLTAAEQALASIPLPPATGKLPSGARTMQWEELDGSPAKTRAGGPKVLGQSAIELRIELGRTHVGREEAQKLRTGSVVPLDSLASDAVAVYASGRLIARGEAIVLDGKFGVRVTEVISPVGGN